MVLKQGFLKKTHLALLLYVYFARMCLDLASDSGVAKVNDRWCAKITARKLHTERWPPFEGAVVCILIRAQQQLLNGQ